VAAHRQIVICVMIVGQCVRQLRLLTISKRSIFLNRLDLYPINYPNKIHSGWMYSREARQARTLFRCRTEGLTPMALIFTHEDGKP
jgi:hypothetical protein